MRYSLETLDQMSWRVDMPTAHFIAITDNFTQDTAIDFRTHTRAHPNTERHTHKHTR